ncbi:MAG: hypothetical protein QM796_18380 [Chthoniobacteraceae bacterium]
MRNGKIARLSPDLREQVNQRLNDGQAGTEIAAWLNTLPEVEAVLKLHFNGAKVDKYNLSHWRKGGYLEWQKRQGRLENLKMLSGYCLQLGREGEAVVEGAAAIAGGKILAALEQIAEEPGAGGEAEREGTAEGRLIGLSNAIAKLHDANSKMIRARLSIRNADQRDQQLALEEKRFQRQTGELFLKFYQDQRAREIAESKASAEVKMEQLVELMFGPRPGLATEITEGTENPAGPQAIFKTS